ncbi:MAG: hypothetical protein ACFFCK_06875 [Promethearchaeota archaeon]
MTSDSSVPEVDVDLEDESDASDNLELAAIEPCLSLFCTCCSLLLVVITLSVAFGFIIPMSDPIVAVTGVGLSTLTLAVVLLAIQVYRSHEVRRRDSRKT